MAPHSMAFSPDGSRCVPRLAESVGVLYSQLRYTLSETSLYCGFENAVEIFDVARPGEAGFRMQTTPTRSSRSGQKGKVAPLFLIAESYVARSLTPARYRDHLLARVFAL